MPRRSRSPLVGSGTAEVAVQEEDRNMFVEPVPLMLPNDALTSEPAALVVTDFNEETM